MVSLCWGRDMLRKLTVVYLKFFCIVMAEVPGRCPWRNGLITYRISYSEFLLSSELWSNNYCITHELYAVFDFSALVLLLVSSMEGFIWHILPTIIKSRKFQGSLNIQTSSTLEVCFLYILWGELIYQR